MTKVVPYDARSLKKLGCKLLHSWGGGQTQSVIIITLFFSILTASLRLSISRVSHGWCTIDMDIYISKLFRVQFNVFTRVFHSVILK